MRTISENTYISEFMVVYFNESKKYGNTINVNASNYPDLKELCDKIKGSPMHEYEGKFFTKFKIAKGIKMFDLNKKEIRDDIDDVLKHNEVKILFEARPWTMSGKSGVSFIAQQLQIKEKTDKFKECVFD